MPGGFDYRLPAVRSLRSPTAFRDLAPSTASFRDAVLAGLRRTSKQLSCKFLYDERGSQLFEAICDLDEYYPFRAETDLLRRHAAGIAAALGPGCQLIEFGAGATVKIRLLLAALERPSAYVPVDISGDHLRQAAAALAADYPGLPVIAVCADYTRRFPLPDLAPGAGRRVGLFLGSTIGNFSAPEAIAFLATAAEQLQGGGMLVGVDLKKDPAVLDAAYNDAKGVTAAFILNLLTRINRELDGSFDLANFAYVGAYNADAGRVEMFIESRRDQVVRVAGQPIRFRSGERVHVENSHKYSVAEFRALAAHAGFRPENVWTDAMNLFSLHYLAAP